MIYRYKRVNPQLSEYVRTVLYLNASDNSEPYNLPLFTRGMPTLLCKTGTKSNQVTIFGQSVPDSEWAVEHNSDLIAFFFKPFTISTIFNIPAQELKESSIELNLWNAQKAMALNMQLFHSNSIEEKIEILDQFVLSQVRSNQVKCDVIRYATDKMMQESNADVLSDILQELHLTERTFQRIFKKYVGITANEYRRICQFYFAFSQLKGGHFDSLTDVAYNNDYFDQSHYIRAFREFTDTTPGDYLQFGLKKE